MALPSKRAGVGWGDSVVKSGGACLLVLSLAALPIEADCKDSKPLISSRSVPLIELGGNTFRDLDRNGALTPFEDWRLAPDVRARDLVSRLTIAEKAGLTMHGVLTVGDNTAGIGKGGYNTSLATEQIVRDHISSFITRLRENPRVIAEENNKIQAIAESSRIAIPVTISSDPRNHFQAAIGASTDAVGFSQWPELLGFASLGDPGRVKRFAQIASQEYRAAGIHMALSPQADLFTEPRWSRGIGTFGADPKLARALVRAYVEGFQGSAVGPTTTGVLSIVKHWVAYGAAPQGFDSHNFYGRFANVDNRSLRLHIEPFKGAFDAHVAGIMPTYSIVQGATLAGQPLEPVGAGYSRQLLTDLLKGKFGYSGLIISDWSITKDCPALCSQPDRIQPHAFMATPWGVEGLASTLRYAKAMNAGIDQFGGVSDSSAVVAAVSSGLVTESRLTEAAYKVLLGKFQLGLFENPFVDPAAAQALTERPVVKSEALRAQAQSQVLLKNQGGILPIRQGAKVWLNGVSADAAVRYGLTVVTDPADADIIVIRTATPFEQLHPLYYAGSRQHEGRLDFGPGVPAFDLAARLKGTAPIVLSVFADRPPVLGAMTSLSNAIILDFGASDEALILALMALEPATGRLPIEVPASMAAVEAQNPAIPNDSRSPLFARGFGIVLPRTGAR